MENLPQFIATEKDRLLALRSRLSELERGRFDVNDEVYGSCVVAEVRTLARISRAEALLEVMR